MTGVAYVDVPRVAKDEAAFVAIMKLPEELQAYAREWWVYLQHAGIQPNPEEYNLTFAQSQQARIALATIV